MNLNMAHLHLLLNHFPILGSIFILVMFAIALIFRNTFLQKVSLWFLVAIALLTALTYFTGGRAVDAVEGLSTTSMAMVELHENAARIGLILMFFTGLIAVGSLFLFWRRAKLPNVVLALILIVLLLNTGVFVYVGYLGGQITHPEIRNATIF
jgi:uncharacterized membrane protein